jgi:hypothetical protein
MIDGGTLFVIVFGGMVILPFIMIVLWHMLHFILCKKYDDLLFREPYFRITELAVYSAWPLSLFRSMGYVLLLGAPSLATKRRFKNVVLDLSEEFFLVLACKILLLILVLSLLFVLAMIVMGIASYFPDAGPLT